MRFEINRKIVVREAVNQNETANVQQTGKASSRTEKARVQRLCVILDFKLRSNETQIIYRFFYFKTELYNQAKSSNNFFQ